MCIRKERIGKDYLTEDDGSVGFVCPRCVFGEECRKQTSEKQKLNGNRSLENGTDCKSR